MKTYTVMVVADITMYGTIDIEAESIEQAINLAMDKPEEITMDISDGPALDHRVAEVMDPDTAETLWVA